ncbi:LysR family transcriptional regulator [Myxococcota bacterium]|nr:LysR family transcriptional regulator [Myxococcota bacterium]
MALDWLNYHHLHYFWLVAREGSLTRAAARLRLAPSTVSAQIKALEGTLGAPLFARQGRRLVPTPTGRLVAAYADEIFGLGRELVDTVRHAGDSDRALRLRVGVASIVPRLVGWRLLSPVLEVDGRPVHLSCRVDSAEALVADLALHRLDLVLADAPVGLAREVHADSRLLGHSGVTVLGTPALAERFGPGFPGSLAGAPMLLPDAATTLRGGIEAFLLQRDLAPQVVAEFSDSALMKAFGRRGAGLFPVPSLVRDEVVATYGVVPLGELEGVVERLYALTMPRRTPHPAVQGVIAAAEAGLEQEDRG